MTKYPSVISFKIRYKTLRIVTLRFQITQERGSSIYLTWERHVRQIGTLSFQTMQWRVLRFVRNLIFTARKTFPISFSILSYLPNLSYLQWVTKHGESLRLQITQESVMSESPIWSANCVPLASVLLRSHMMIPLISSSRYSMLVNEEMGEYRHRTAWCSWFPRLRTSLVVQLAEVLLSQITWVVKYLQGRQISQKVGEENPRLRKFKQGVPKDAMLFPLLFKLYGKHIYSNVSVILLDFTIL